MAGFGPGMAYSWPSAYKWSRPSPIQYYHRRTFVISPWWPRVHTLDFARMVKSHLGNGTNTAAFARVMEELRQTYGNPVDSKDLPRPERNTQQPKRKSKSRRPSENNVAARPGTVSGDYRLRLLGITPGRAGIVVESRQRFSLSNEWWGVANLIDCMVAEGDQVVRPWTYSDSSTVYSVCSINGVLEAASAVSRFVRQRLPIESSEYENLPWSHGYQHPVLVRQSTNSGDCGGARSRANCRPAAKTGADETHESQPQLGLQLTVLLRPVIATRDQATWSMTLDVLRRDLVGLIELLVNTPGRWILRLLVGKPEGRYVQLLAHEDGSLLYEASSNNFLEGADRLTSDQEQALASLGWAEPGGENRPNWWSAEATIHPDTRAVAQRVLTTLEKVFGLRASDTITGNIISVRVIAAIHPRPKQPRNLMRSCNPGKPTAGSS